MFHEGISKEDSKTILMTLCAYADVDYYDIDFASPDWYTQHTWTPSEEQAFIKWLAEFLIKKKYVINNKKKALHEAEKIDAQYGWKTVG